jgi:hypothetical protein
MVAESVNTRYSLNSFEEYFHAVRSVVLWWWCWADLALECIFMYRR